MVSLVSRPSPSYTTSWDSTGVSVLFHEVKEMKLFPKLASVLSSGRKQNLLSHLRFVNESERQGQDMPQSLNARQRLRPKNS